MMWVGLHSIVGVIGPFYIDEIDPPYKNLDSASYIKMLSEDVIPELKRRLTNEQYGRLIFQQDGAGPHTSLESLAFLYSEFDNRVISNRADWLYQWPPYSPDLNPLDYSFWSNIKTYVKFNNQETIDEGKLMLTAFCHNFPIDRVKKIISDFPIRIEALLSEKGGQFEPKYQSFYCDLSPLLGLLGTEWWKSPFGDYSQAHSPDWTIVDNLARLPTADGAATNH